VAKKVNNVSVCPTFPFRYYIIFLHGTRLAKKTLQNLTDINDNHFTCGTAEVNNAKGIAAGRPYGGTAILWNKELNAKTFVIQAIQKYYWSGDMFKFNLLDFFECIHTLLLRIQL